MARKQLEQRIRAIGPYLLLELFMPGGTVIAGLLFLCRRKVGVAQAGAEARASAAPGDAPQSVFVAANP
jgi:hypothetical protein